MEHKVAVIQSLPIIVDYASPEELSCSLLYYAMHFTGRPVGSMKPVNIFLVPLVERLFLAAAYRSINMLLHTTRNDSFQSVEKI